MHTTTITKQSNPNQIMPIISIDTLIEDENWRTALVNYEDLINKSVSQTLNHIKTLDDTNQLIEVSVTLTNDQNIQKLNNNFRQKDKPTNVLSFPQNDWSTEDWKDDPVLLLGDVVVSFQTIHKEAEEQSKSLEHHFTHMLVHSIVHLFGYDHETDDEAEEMEALEIQILKQMGIKNPYQIN